MHINKNKIKMKKVVTILLLLLTAGTMFAQKPKGELGPKGSPSEGHKTLTAQRKFEIIVENERDSNAVRKVNSDLNALQIASRNGGERGLFGDLLWTGFTSSIKQKTVNATSNLVSMGLNYVTEALKSDREKWYRRAQQQCFYQKVLSAETRIDDFYALPSVKGAMDPENMKFKGFGLKNYIAVVDDNNTGVGVFYIFCKMRRDSIGLSHIINHSKFLVEVDSVVFNPKYCNLPNDSIDDADSYFSFEKRKNLNLQLKTKIYSSWMNQAIMITNNQLLGEFTVNVSVDKNLLNKDSVFVYDKNDPRYDGLVSVDGDCYIVPRSFSGTPDAINYQPTWGTGQYRIEMEVSESCEIVDEYYKIRESGNGEDVAFASGTKGKKKWDKAKWKTEWKAMNTRRKSDSLLKNAWKCTISAYKGSGWVATLTDPATTALYDYEAQKLDDWMNDLHDKWFSGEVSPSASSGSTPNTSSKGKPSGNLPKM